MSDEKELSPLEAIKAKREALAAARAAKLAPVLEAVAVARETQALSDDEAFAAAQDEHGIDNVARIETVLGAIIVKKPTRALYSWSQEQKKLDAVTLEKLVAPCITAAAVGGKSTPDPARFALMLREQPHCLVDAANACAELAGADYEKRKAK